MPAGETPYDAVAYPSHAFPNTHPDRMAAMAILYGLAPTPVDRCRVLEIGCGDGANLVPMAYAIPGSEFVGFDLAHQPIERAQEWIRQLGLKNIRLFQLNLLDAGPELGTFDYIIVHGLYAWVPEPVRDRLLALCSQLLAPNGVAFVSYNALPGGHIRIAMREMMLFSAEGIEDPEKRIAASVAFLRSLIGARPEGDAYRALIEGQIKRLEERAPRALYHDEFAEEYHPVRFIDFVQHAQKHSLQFLNDSELPPPNDPCYQTQIRTVLEKAAPEDILKQEQMLDFARMRLYRETLLCRANHSLRRDFPAEHFRKLLLASPAVSTRNEASGAISFVLPGGIKMETSHPGVNSLLMRLEAAWPHSLSFADIEPTLAGSGLALDTATTLLLMRLVVAKFVEIHSWNAPVSVAIPERPRATLVARQQARIQATATTLLHLTIQLDDPIIRAFLPLLDGTRTRNELLAALKTELPAIFPAEIENGMEPALQHFYRAGVLEA